MVDRAGRPEADAALPTRLAVNDPCGTEIALEKEGVMKTINRLVVAGVTIGFLATACSSSSPSAGSEPASGGAEPSQAGATTVAEKVSEFAISDSVGSVPAGSVDFSVTNTGKVEHEFVILKTDKPAADLPLEKEGGASEAGAVDEIEGIKPGGTESLAVELPAGHYVLICNLPGHYTSGMHTDLTVG